MFICIYVYVCVCVCVCIYVYIKRHLVHAVLRWRDQRQASVCYYVLLYYVDICIYIYIYTHICIYIHAYMYVHKCIDEYIGDTYCIVLYDIAHAVLQWRERRQAQPIGWNQTYDSIVLHSTAQHSIVQYSTV